MSRNIDDIQFDCINIKFGSEETVKKTANIHLSIFVQTWGPNLLKIGESKRRVGIPTFFYFNKR